MNAADIDASRDKTIDDFGRQWTHFQDNPGYYGSLSLFADLIAPFFAPADFRGKRVVDVGSGTGRIVQMLAEAGATHIVAVEPSAAMTVLRENTRHLADRIQYRQQPGDQVLTEEPMDFAISLGVLHHIPDPGPVVARMRNALQPGGYAIIWLYGREGNGAYLMLANPLRAITTRLPHRALLMLSRVLDIPLSIYAMACRHFSLPLSKYMTEHLGRLSPAIRRLTIYDQLNPRWAKYYRRSEALGLLENGGFVDVRCHHRHGYSWLVVGRKPVNDNQSSLRQRS
jgi:2-polyprenyl-3-methyl-5-hydroxy-6-metoxy-1,4-benzoquinol methylase